MHFSILLLTAGSVLAARTIPAPLIQTDFEAFMSCMEPVMSTYNIKTQEGWTVLSPVDNRRLASSTTDLTMFNCMEDHQALLVKAQGTMYDETEPSNIRNLTGTTFEWMLENNASGKTVTGLTKRADSDGASFDFYGSLESDCSDEEHFITAVEDCKTVTMKFICSQFGNPTFCRTLHATAWPHHECKKGNEHMYVVTPGTTSGCDKRNVFSWEGTYVNARTCATPS